jgi:proline iminopeptidase
MKNVIQSSLTFLKVIVKAILFVILLSVDSDGTLLAQDPVDDYTVINGAKIWYKTDGKGEPLLLIPGGPGFSHLYFTPHFAKLSDKFNIIYFDAFGRGKSDRAKSPDEYSIKRDVEDIEGLRKYLGIDKLNIFGHSYGGIVAQVYALKYPDHIRKLILSNTLFNSEMCQAMITNLNNEIQNQFPEIWEKLKLIRERDHKSSSIEYLMTSSPVSLQLGYFYDASNAQRLNGDKYSFNPDVYFSLAGDLGNLDFSIQLKEIKIPTLVIGGRFDRVCLPKYTLLYKKFMPQAKFVMFEESGHFPYIEEPLKFCETLETFLSN